MGVVGFLFLTTLARLVCCAGPGRFSPHTRAARIKKSGVSGASGHAGIDWLDAGPLPRMKQWTPSNGQQELV